MATRILIEAPPGVLNPEKYPVQSFEKVFPDGIEGIQPYAEKLRAFYARNWKLPVEQINFVVEEVQ